MTEGVAFNFDIHQLIGSGGLTRCKFEVGFKQQPIIEGHSLKARLCWLQTRHNRWVGPLNHSCNLAFGTTATMTVFNQARNHPITMPSPVEVHAIDINILHPWLIANRKAKTFAALT